MKKVIGRLPELLSTLFIGAGGLGFDYRSVKSDTVSSTARPRWDDS